MSKITLASDFSDTGIQRNATQSRSHSRVDLDQITKIVVEVRYPTPPNPQPQCETDETSGRQQKPADSSRSTVLECQFNQRLMKLNHREEQYFEFGLRSWRGLP